MRHWLLLLALTALIASPIAPAAPTVADELATMNAVSQAWDRYAELSSRNDPASAELLATSTIAHFAFLRDASLVASAGQVRRLPLSDRVVLYALRATQDEAALAALDGEAVARLCTGEGWCGVAAADEGARLPALSHVTVVGANRAIGEMAPPTGMQFQFGPEFVLEDDRWKVMAESLIGDESTHIQQQIQQGSMDETQMTEFLLARFLGEARPAPALAMLDLPPRDDRALRTRLNEDWPDYAATYQTRIRAVEMKAADGDTLAQFALGAMLYNGDVPHLVEQDKARGLALLEQASDSGHGRAAGMVAGELLAGDDLPEDQPIPPERLARALPHVQRSAADGQPMAMTALGGFHFNGAAGLARNCTQAEEWFARAEDGGMAEARNERVWALAACPIAAQRDAERALSLAAHMIDNAERLSAAELDTVAAAFAANGQFEDAVAYQQRAIAGLDDDSSDATRRGMRERLRAYDKDQDWVQTYNAYAQQP